MGDNIEQFELEDVGFTTNEKVAGRDSETQEKSGCGNWKWYLLALGALLLLAIIGSVIGVSLKSGDNSSAAGELQDLLTTEPPITTEGKTETRPTISGLYLTFAFSFGNKTEYIQS